VNTYALVAVAALSWTVIYCPVTFNWDITWPWPWFWVGIFCMSHV